MSEKDRADEATAVERLFVGRGEMRARCRAFDWSATPIGPVRSWSASLRTGVQVMLASGFPSALSVGPGSTLLYNDAWAELIGPRHPEALGRSGLETFPEGRPVYAPQAERVRAGESVTVKDQRMPMLRDGSVQDAWFSTSYAPLRDDETGAVIAVMVTSVETSAVRASEERKAFLLALSDRLRALDEPDAITRAACTLLGERLAASRCHYVDIDASGLVARPGYVDGVDPLAEVRRPMSAFGTAMLAKADGGEPVVVTDVASDPRFSVAEREAYAGVQIAAFTVVLLEKHGRVVGGVALNQSTPRCWTRDEIDLQRELLDRLWDALERARAHAVLRESEARHRSLFESMDQGVQHCELIRDDAGVAVDVRLLRVNPAWRTLMGIPPETVIGKRVSDWLPNMEQSWVGRWDRIVRSGRGERFEQYAPDLGRWFDVFVSPLEHDQFIALFTDTTARKEQERRLRESDERNAFLLALSDAIRPLNDAEAIGDTIARALGEHLGVTRVAYGEVSDDGEHIDVRRNYVAPGASQIVGRFRMADYGEPLLDVLRAGRPLVIPDLANAPELSESARQGYASLGIGALVGVPLVKEGRFVANIIIHHHAPRAWTESEVTLVREVADRAWAAVERARAARAVRVSEEKYRSLFETMDEGFAFCEIVRDAAGRAVDYRLLEVNPAFELHSGLSRAGGRLRNDLLSVPDDEAIAIYEQVVRTATPARFERHSPAIDRWVDLAVYPRGGERFALVFSDISSRKRAESVLRQSEGRQAFLLELSDRLRALADPLAIPREASRMLGEHLRVNRAHYGSIEGDEVTVRDGYEDGVDPVPERYRWTDGLGSLREAFLATETIAVNDAAADPRLSDAEKATLARMQVGSLAGAMLRKGGRWVGAFGVHARTPRVWTESELALLREVGDRIWDAVERARAEAALRENQTRLAVMFEALPVGIGLMDTNGALVLANAVMRRFLPAGVMPSRDASRYGRWRAFHHDGRRLERDEYSGARALRGETVVPGIEFLYEAEDGTEIWTRVAALPVSDDEGRITGAVAAVMDIDAIKRTEQALRQSEALLRASEARARALLADAQSANRAKDEFLATLSHELRTPLAAILFWAGALRTGAVAPHELARAIDAIGKSAEAQSRLIEDLLDLSRLTSGKLVLVPSPVRAEDVIHAAVDIVRPIAQAKDLALVTEIDGDLGTALVDEPRLKQILWNLLTNGVKFTPEGGRVTLRARRDGDWLEMVIADTGEGIAPEFMAHLFEKFRQADMADTRQHMGLGIGLALTKQLVELHGGTIDAESDGIGRGARFRVRLPWTEHRADAPAPVARQPGRASAALDGLRVLLVEDDASTREAMERMLTRAGAAVVAVATGAEALATLASADAPEVIVSDLGLPGMSGYELIERVVKEHERRSRPPPPSCAVSAHAREIDRQRAIEAGFDMYLAKPVTAERLIEAVADLRDVLASKRD